MTRIGLAQVAIERAEHRGRRRDHRLLAGEEAREIDAGEKSGRRALGVALDAGELAGEQRRRVVPEREVRRERGGRVEIRVPMDGAEAQELRVLESGDDPEHALLLGIAKARLEADEIPHAAGAILHAQLHDGVRLAAGARIDEADRLHRPEAQRLASALRHLLGGHAPLEVRHGVELVRRGLVGVRERVEKGLVLLARSIGQLRYAPSSSPSIVSLP